MSASMLRRRLALPMFTDMTSEHVESVVAELDRALAATSNSG